MTKSTTNLRPEHVEGARGMLKMSQADLAKASGVAKSTIEDFESGKRVPRSDTLERLREALERRGIEFLYGESPGVRLHPDKAVIHV